MSDHGPPTVSESADARTDGGTTRDEQTATDGAATNGATTGGGTIDGGATDGVTTDGGTVDGVTTDAAATSENAGTTTPMIEASDVRVRLGGNEVLTGVSLSVERGELVGLVGPNGAGKTTTLAALNNTLTPDAGTVRLDGESVSALSRRETARRVATVPQETGLSFEFSVRSVVEMGRTPYVSRFGRTTNEDRAAVDRAMERAAVTEFADRSVTSLSGGERQRVLLARALAQETPALLLDEPTANLDINHQVRTLSLIREVVDAGKATLAAIHDLNLAARFCDRLALLADGEIRVVGDPETVLADDAVSEAFGVPIALDTNPTTDDPLVTALREEE